MAAAWTRDAWWIVFAVVLLIAHLPALIFTPYAVVFLYCAVTCGFGVATYRNVHRARAWPAAAGEITRSRVAREASVDQGEVGEYDTPDIAYAYEVDGRRYTDRLLKAGDQYKTRVRWLVDRWLARYPVGAPVQVHWRPDKPSESFVFPRPVVPWLLPLAGGLLFALVDVAVFVDAYRANPAYHRWNLLTIAGGAAAIALVAAVTRTPRQPS